MSFNNSSLCAWVSVLDPSRWSIPPDILWCHSSLDEKWPFLFWLQEHPYQASGQLPQTQPRLSQASRLLWEYATSPRLSWTCLPLDGPGFCSWICCHRCCSPLSILSLSFLVFVDSYNLKKNPFSFFTIKVTILIFVFNLLVFPLKASFSLLSLCPLALTCPWIKATGSAVSAQLGQGFSYGSSRYNGKMVSLKTDRWGSNPSLLSWQTKTNYFNFYYF